jgi:DNA-binding transcriptional MerR regulator
MPPIAPSGRRSTNASIPTPGPKPTARTESARAGSSSATAASSMSRFSRAMAIPATLPDTPSKFLVIAPMKPTQALEVRFKSMPDLLDIGEVAARSGMAASALRYYERERIIESVDRKGLRRQYRPEVMTTLAVVAMCRQAGFSLEEIKSLLATGGRSEWKTFAVHKRDELRAQAEHLGALADQLDHAVGCPSPNVFDCVHFRAALNEALPVESRPRAIKGGP